MVFVSVSASSQGLIANSAAITTTFVPDLPGIYVVRLVANDGRVKSAPTNVQVQVVTRTAPAIQGIRDLENAIMALPASAFRFPNLANPVKTLAIRELDSVITDIQAGRYLAALTKLGLDIFPTGGCATIGAPDKNDWIMNCAAQGQVYPLIIEVIRLLGG